MNREYLVHKYFNLNGRVSTSSERRVFDGTKDMKADLVNEYKEQLKDDPEFIRVRVVSLPQNGIDFELMERMNAVRGICELGHKVRAATKIRNRQPLRNAYVSFTDRDMQDYMIYIGCGNNDFADTIKEELNVLDVQFIDEQAEQLIFDYNLKPNFRSLGPKGYGKQAQTLKSHISAMNSDDRSNLYHRLKNGEIVVVIDIPLTLSDIDVEFAAKENFMSASDKVGAIVLDTTLDDNLVASGFVADFRAAIQNIRKDAALNITDRIFLEVYCEPKRAIVIEKQMHRLTKELLATEIKFFPPDNNVVDAHKFCFHGGILKTPDQVANDCELDKEIFSVRLYKEGS
jgi:isoleucyl-tRNA synthetase